MDAVRHLGCWKEAYLDVPHAGDQIFYLHTEFGEDVLICGGYALIIESKQHRLAAEFYFRFQFGHVFSYGNLPVCDRTKFQPNDTETICTTVPNDPLTDPTRKHPKWRNHTSDREQTTLCIAMLS